MSILFWFFQVISIDTFEPLRFDFPVLASAANEPPKEIIIIIVVILTHFIWILNFDTFDERSSAVSIIIIIIILVIIIIIQIRETFSIWNRMRALHKFPINSLWAMTCQNIQFRELNWKCSQTATDKSANFTRLIFPFTAHMPCSGRN